MRRLGIITALSMLVLALSASVAFAAISTNINPANAPTGTHLQTGTIGCSVDSSTLLVTCSTFELGGVGGANATGSLATTYSATVDCTNNGGKLVPVKSTAQTTPTTTGSLSPKNGRLSVPSLNSGPLPTAGGFEAAAARPQRHRTKPPAGGGNSPPALTASPTVAGLHPAP